MHSDTETTQNASVRRIERDAMVAARWSRERTSARRNFEGSWELGVTWDTNRHHQTFTVAVHICAFVMQKEETHLDIATGSFAPAFTKPTSKALLLACGLPSPYRCRMSIVITRSLVLAAVLLLRYPHGTIINSSGFMFATSSTSSESTSRKMTKMLLKHQI